jgi:hypothetical protein
MGAGYRKGDGANLSFRDFGTCQEFEGDFRTHCNAGGFAAC